MVDLRARQTIGLFFQPHGSVSPFTFAVKISLMLSAGENSANTNDIDNIKNKNLIINYLHLK